MSNCKMPAVPRLARVALAASVLVSHPPLAGAQAASQAQTQQTNANAQISDFTLANGLEVVVIPDRRVSVVTQQKQNEVVESELDLLAWFDDQVEQSGQLFQKYLAFKTNL